MKTGFHLKIRDHLHDPEKKRNFNEAHFSEAASRYDIATRAMSLGRDLAWKRALIDALPLDGATLCVDLACGTGDISFALAHRYPRGKILGLDIAEPMLEKARLRLTTDNILFEKRDMCDSGLEDASVDILTGSYAIRNAPRIEDALREIARIMKPGGTVALLDFSKSPNRTRQRIDAAVLKYWCGLWGLLLHGNPEVHSYIAASLKTFPDRERLRALFAEHNLELQSTRPFYFGMLELLVLKRKGGDE